MAHALPCRSRRISPISVIFLKKLSCYVTIMYSTPRSLQSNNIHTFPSQSCITRYVLLPQRASCRYFIFHLIIRPWRNRISIILIDFWNYKYLFKLKRHIQINKKNWHKPAQREKKEGGGFHTLSSGSTGAILCACKAMEALICLAFSIFASIAEGPHLHFSMNLCCILNKIFFNSE